MLSKEQHVHIYTQLLLDFYYDLNFSSSNNSLLFYLGLMFIEFFYHVSGISPNMIKLKRSLTGKPKNK